MESTVTTPNIFSHNKKHVIALVAIVSIVTFAFVFVGFDALSYAQDETERTIVNDDYFTVTADISFGGITQQLQVKSGTTIYGVSLKFLLVSPDSSGIVTAQLFDKGQNLLDTVCVSVSELRNDEFYKFMLSNKIECKEDTEIYLNITSDVSGIFLWKSEFSYEGFALNESNKSTDGTLALQYITRYVGKDIVKYYAIIFAISCIAAVGVYIVAFILKAKHEYVFIIAALTIGLLFSIFTPFGGAPDESVHIASAYKLSNRILGVDEHGGSGTVTVRTCDGNGYIDAPVEYNSYSFQSIFNGLKSFKAQDETLSVVETRTADVFSLQYFSQAIGVTAARLLHLNYTWLVLLGRFFNLLAYTLICFFAIKIMPIYKTTLTLCALLPMSLQLAGSFSYDAYVLCLSFLGIALVFSISYGEKKPDIIKIIACAVAFALLAPAKAVYILLSLIVLIIPSERLGCKKKSFFAKVSILAVALLFWAVFNLNAAVGTLSSRVAVESSIISENSDATAVDEGNDITDESVTLYPNDSVESSNSEPQGFYDPNGEILENGDSKYYFSLQYILRNPVQTSRLLIHSFVTQFDKYLNSLLGTRLGELIIVDLTSSEIWTVAIMAILFLSMLHVDGDLIIYKGFAKLWGVAIFLAVCAAVVLVCVMWTPINYDTVFGIQGRYILPALPLLLMGLQSKWLRLTRRIDRFLIFAIVPVDIFIILNVFHIMA